MVARPYRGWRRIVAAWLVISVVALGAELLPAHACPRHGAAMMPAMLSGVVSDNPATHTAAGTATADSPNANGTRSGHHDSSPDTDRHHCTCPGECCTPPGIALTPSPLAWQVATLVEPARSISAPRARITTEDPRLGLPFATAPPRG
jgi:hypothetical protein